MMEEENRALVAELNAWRSEAARAQEASQAARHEECATQAEMKLVEESRRNAQNDAAELQSEVAFLRQTLSEAAAGSASLESRACDYGAARDRLSAELAMSQLSLSAQEGEASSFESIAARAELKASREEAGRLEAETSRDCIQAELNMAQGRLVNRGTHVDLLLRDKERLWGQLARARRHTSKDDVKEAPETPKKAATAAKIRPASASGRPRPHSASGQSCVTPPKLSCRRSPSVSDTTDRRTAAPPPDEHCLELERQLWHLQRALARERAAHEQAREAMRINGWRSKSVAVCASSQEEESSDV